MRLSRKAAYLLGWTGKGRRLSTCQKRSAYGASHRQARQQNPTPDTRRQWLTRGGKTVSTPGGEQKVGFASDTAEATGQTKQSINQHVSRAEALGDDLLEVTGTSLDKGVELDALKAMPEPERKELIQKAKAGEKVTARKQQEAPLRASEAVSMVIRQLDIFLMVLATSGISVDQLADRFADEFDPSDATTKAKVEAIIPLLDALARIGAELDLEEAV